LYPGNAAQLHRVHYVCPAVARVMKAFVVELNEVDRQARERHLTRSGAMASNAG